MIECFAESARYVEAALMHSQIHDMKVKPCVERCAALAWTEAMSAAWLYLTALE